MYAAHWRLAYMAALGLITLMGRAAIVAYVERVRCEPSAVFRADAGGELCLIYAVSTALVIDQAPGSKLGDGDETGPLKIGSLWPATAHGRHICVKRQAGEIVA